MKYLHNIKITVFVKPDEDLELIKTTLINLIPFNLEKEKIQLKESTATSFEQRKIIVLNISLAKTRHTNSFLKFLLNKLSGEQKQLLLKQALSRLDNEQKFFIRLDKNYLLNNKFKITDSGDCFHIKMGIASFPSTKQNSLKIIKELLTTFK